MLNIQKLIIDHFIKDLRVSCEQSYDTMQPEVAPILEWSGQLALENIACSDALYHDLEHTMMVTSVGQAILKGRHLLEGGVTPAIWLHFVMALLFHDIGYIKGICRDDEDGLYATGVNGHRISLNCGGTDAALSAYHVDRGKQFVRERFGDQLLTDLVDHRIICDYIEMTRFPIPDSSARYQETASYGALVRAADFIGQLGDPNYLRKIPALFYEFEESGKNAELGYETPGDIRNSYTTFHWEVVRPYISDALRYLKVTQEGREWIANLHSHVFDLEHEH